MSILKLPEYVGATLERICAAYKVVMWCSKNILYTYLEWCIMSLRSLSIKAKLLNLILLASTACFAIVGAGLYLSYTRMYQDRVDSLRFMVEAGHSMATKLEA